MLSCVCGLGFKDSGNFVEIAFFIKELSVILMDN